MEKKGRRKKKQVFLVVTIEVGYQLFQWQRIVEFKNFMINQKLIEILFYGDFSSSSRIFLMYLKDDVIRSSLSF
jgi:hypothetical protein